MSNNNKVTTISFNFENLKIILNEIKTIIDYSDTLFKITTCMNNYFSKKYTQLENKWYVYSFHSMDNDALLNLMKVHDTQKDSFSLANILNYLNCQKSASNIKFDIRKFDNILNEYNNFILLKTLRERRNKLHVHLTRESILQGRKSDYIDMVNIREAKEIVRFSYKICNDLAKLLNYSLDSTTNNLSSPLNQVRKFILLLDDYGNLP